MKILVTGGAGFIGSAVVPCLQADGHEVYVIDNLSFGKREFIELDDEHFFELDIRESGNVLRAVQQVRPEIVIHLAAVHFIPYCNQHPFESADINIRGTINILDALAIVGTAQKLFFASTAAVYPIYDEPVTEKHEVRPLDIYGLSKLAGERLCEEFYLKTDTSTVVCRFFNAFGPNETNPHLIPEIERQLRDGVRKICLGNLKPKRDFIHTNDMANAVRSLIELDVKGFDAFNLGRGVEYAVTEVVEAFSQELGEEIHIEVDPARVRKTDRMHLLADVSKLKQATGWSPEWSLNNGIKNLIDNW